MDEEVLAALVRRDEAEALVVVEPLHGSGCHLIPPLLGALRTRRMLRGNDCGARHCVVEPAALDLMDTRVPHGPTGDLWPPHRATGEAAGQRDSCHLPASICTSSARCSPSCRPDSSRMAKARE